MKKKDVRKLKLQKETLSQLEAMGLALVHGGTSFELTCESCGSGIPSCKDVYCWA